uniref:Uncharacterized protein n=1 Tax=Anguilla anguilla TaxID=7936 RepID=A0A0E9RC50_ANGAN
MHDESLVDSKRPADKRKVLDPSYRCCKCKWHQS